MLGQVFIPKNLAFSHALYTSVKPFYYNFSFIICLTIIFYFLLTLLFKKHSNYNKDFVKKYSQIETTRKQSSLYFLFLGIAIPGIDLIIELSGTRVRDTLGLNLATGFCLLLIYFLSKKYSFVYNNITVFLSTLFLLYGITTIVSIVKHPNSIPAALEFEFMFFLSYTVFRKVKQYRIFVISTLTLLLFLSVSGYIEEKQAVNFFAYLVLIIVVNQVRYITNLNANDTFLFTDNIVNKGTSLVLAVNKKGEVVYCSDTITPILGYTREEVKGYNYWELTNDKEFTTINYTINESLYIRKLRCKDGSFKFIQWKDSKYSDDLYLGIGQDVTDQIEVQNQYKKLIESASDIIYETDRHGNLTFINSFTEKTLGYKIEDELGKHFSRYIHQDYVDTVIKYYIDCSLKKDEIPYIEFPIIKKNGEMLWVSQKVTLTRNAEGEITGHVAIARDTTFIKKIELEQNERKEKVESYNNTINNLLRNTYKANDSFQDIICQILKRLSKESKIDRVSYWNYTSEKISCVSLYELERDCFSCGQDILRTNCPIYFESINNENAVISSNVYESKHTKEFVNDYFPNNNILSMLDVPVIANGEKAAILCFETTQQQRNWDNDDVNFARSISDIISVAVETKKRIETEEKLASKSDILLAISISTEKILKSDNIQTILTDVFAIIAKATKVDRIYYFKNNEAQKTMSQQKEWVNTNIEPQIDNLELQNLPHYGNELFMDFISNNKVFSAVVKDIKDAKIRARLEKQNILTILIFPIFVKNKFYGSIGLDDCTLGRIWSEDEIGILQILANNIATAIERLESGTLLQESEERFKLLANNIPGTVYLSENDKKWSKIYVNDEIEKLTGYGKEQFLNNDILLIDFIHPDDHLVITQFEEAIQNRESFHFIYRLKRKSGDYIWVEEFGDVIIKDDKVAYIEGILIDITEKKEIELEIKAREFAEASSKAKTEFLANMSHEIRTPLNAIIGFSNLLQDTKLEKNQLEYITTVNQSASILMEVVNDILDFSKIETGKLELDYQKINLYELANQIIDIIKFDSVQKNIALNLIIDNEIPNYVFLDALRIKQVLLNLLSNAVKFTNKGKVELHIVVESKDETNVKLKFAVVDSGVGIKKGNHKKIFEPFSQEDNSTTRNYGGTGLGLTISNNILGLMNSKLELESDFNKGSTFSFQLNLAYYQNKEPNNGNDFEVEYEDVSHSPKSDVFNMAKTILIVEDNKINMLLAKTLVRNIFPNAVIHEASNGKLGIEKYQETKPDILLLDIQMPILNGYEAAKEIRKTDTTTPIIALTAGTIKGEKSKCLEAGMNDYISKPIIKDVFENMLLKWIQ